MFMWTALGLVVLAAAVPAAAQAAWPNQSEGDFVLKDFGFESGEKLAELNQHYTVLGTPHRNAAGEIDNAVLLLHGTSGTGKNWLMPSLADELFAAGQPLDASKYFIVMPDGIGRGGSSKPSDGLRARFPHYRYADMVDLQHRLGSNRWLRRRHDDVEAILHVTAVVIGRGSRTRTVGDGMAERAELQIADDVCAVVASIKKKENPLTVRKRRDAGNEAHLAVERSAGLVELDDVVRISFDRFFQSHRRDRLDAEWRSFDVRAKHARDDDRAGPFDFESIRRNDVGDGKRLRGDSEDEQRNLGGQGVTMGRRAAYARNGDHAAG